MANEKISQLNSGNPAQAGDLLLIARNGQSLSVSASSVAALNGAGFSGSFTDLTSGTNAAAIFTVGNGGSITFSGVTSPVITHLGSAAAYAILAYSGITGSGADTISGGVIGSAPTMSITGFNPPPATVDNADAAAARTAGNAAFGFYTGLTFTSLSASTVDLSTAGVGGSNRYIPGNYSAGTSMAMSTGIVLDAQGNSNAVFVFWAGSTVNLASGKSVTLINGAQAANVVWCVGSSFTSVATSTMVGNILAYASITLGGGALNGRALAVGGGNGSVTISAATVVTAPSGAFFGIVNANEIFGVTVSGTAPTIGQVLTATSPTTANWQTPAGGGSPSFSTITSGVNNTAQTLTVGSTSSIVVSGTGVVQATKIQAVVISGTAPTTGQVLTATSGTAANWQTPSGGGGTPAGANGQVQYGNFGAFAAAHAIADLLGPAPFGTYPGSGSHPVTLSIYGQTSHSPFTSGDILDVYVQGASVPGMALLSTGDTQGVAIHLSDSVGDTSAITSSSILQEGGFGTAILITPNGGLNPFPFIAGNIVVQRPYASSPTSYTAIGSGNSGQVPGTVVIFNGPGIETGDQFSNSLHSALAVWGGTSSLGGHTDNIQEWYANGQSVGSGIFPATTGGPAISIDTYGHLTAGGVGFTANLDFVGTVAINAPATTGVYTFAKPYAGFNPPVVTVTALAVDPTPFGGVWITYQGGDTSSSTWGIAEIDIDSSWNLTIILASKIVGSWTGGGFQFTPQEQVVQTTTGATAYVANCAFTFQFPSNVPSSTNPSFPLFIGPVTGGSPDNSHTWVGQSSGAIFTPTAVPLAFNPFSMGQTISLFNTIESDFGLWQNGSTMTIASVSGSNIFVTSSATFIAEMVANGVGPPTNSYPLPYTDPPGPSLDNVDKGAVALSTTTGTLWTGFTVNVSNAPQPLIIATSAEDNNSKVVTMVLADKVTGSVASGTFTFGEVVTQSVTGAMAYLVGTVPTGSNPLYISNIMYQATGSVSSGTFNPGERVIQATSGAAAYLMGAVPTGASNMYAMPIFGTSNASDVWTGQDSGATYTPTSVLTSTGTPNSSNIWTGQTSGATYTPTSVPLSYPSFVVGQYISSMAGLTHDTQLNGWPFWNQNNTQNGGQLKGPYNQFGFASSGTSGTTLVFADPTFTGPGLPLAVETGTMTGAGPGQGNATFNYHVIGQS